MYVQGANPHAPGVFGTCAKPWALQCPGGTFSDLLSFSPPYLLNLDDVNHLALPAFQFFSRLLALRLQHPVPAYICKQKLILLCQSVLSSYPTQRRIFSLVVLASPECFPPRRFLCYYVGTQFRVWDGFQCFGCTRKTIPSATTAINPSTKDKNNQKYTIKRVLTAVNNEFV